MKILVSTLVSLFYVVSVAQNTEKIDFNLTITINEELIINVMDIKIKLPDESYVNYGVNYIPGNLTLPHKLYNDIVSDETNSYYLCFYVYENNDRKATNYYEVNLLNGMFKDSELSQHFCVIQIISLNNRKYRKKYKAISTDKNYNYDIILPNYSIINSLK